MKKTILKLTFLFLVGLLSSSMSRREDEDWKAKFCKEFRLRSIREDKNLEGIRIWFGYKQTFEIIRQKGRVKVQLVSYVLEVKGDGKTGNPIFKKSLLANPSVRLMEQLERSYHQLELIGAKYGDKMVSSDEEFERSKADYQFELRRKGLYFDSPIPKIAEPKSEIIVLIDLINQEFDLNSLYNNFFNNLRPGNYFDGKYTYTITKETKGSRK